MLRPLPLATALAVIFAIAAAAQQAAAPAGHWEGSIEVPGQELKVAIDLAPRGPQKTWQGAIAIPAQGVKAMPLSDVTVSGKEVSFGMKSIPGSPTFKGTLSNDGTQIAGSFSQGGGTVPFRLTRTGEAVFEPQPESTTITDDLAKTWEGALDIQGKTLRLVVKLARQPDGTGGGTIVSVDQGGAEIPIAAVRQQESKVSLQVPAVAGSFEGDLKNSVLSGTWSQGGGNWPLVLKPAK